MENLERGKRSKKRVWVISLFILQMVKKTKVIDHSNTPLNLAIVLKHSGERLMYKGGEGETKLTPSSELLKSVRIILQSADIPRVNIDHLMSYGRICNFRSSCDLNNALGVKLIDIGCKGGEGGYKLTLELDAKGAPTVLSKPPSELDGGSEDGGKPGEMAPKSAPKSTPNPNPRPNPSAATSTTAATVAPATPPLPTPTTPTTPTDPVTFLRNCILPLPLMSSSLSPPLVLFFKYFDNVLKTPPSLEYKNRRTINTKNKSFSNTITSFEKVREEPSSNL